MNSKGSIKLFTITVTIIVAILVVVSACATSAPAPTTPAPAAKPTTPPTAAPKPPAAPSPPAAPKELKLKAFGSPTVSDLHAYDVMQSDVLSKIPNVTVAAFPGGGIYVGAEALRKGETQLAMLGPSYIYRGTHGILDQKEAWAKDVRILWAYSSSPQTFFVTKASGIKTLAELDGKRFGYDAGSESSFNGSLIIEAAGARPDYMKSTLATIETAIMNRQCIGVNAPGAPMPVAQRVAASMPITILPVSRDILDKAQKQYPGMFSEAVIPAGTYPDQDKDSPTIDNVLCYATMKDYLSVDTVYQMAKAMYERRNELSKVTKRAEMAANWPEFTIKSSGTPLHAGIVKFLKEDLKLKVPDNLIPPEAK